MPCAVPVPCGALKKRRVHLEHMERAQKERVTGVPGRREQQTAEAEESDSILSASSPFALAIRSRSGLVAQVEPHSAIIQCSRTIPLALLFSVHVR